MRRKQLINLFAGPTEEQLKDIRRREAIEMEFSKFCRLNPGLPIDVYEAKYKSLHEPKEKI